MGHIFFMSFVDVTSYPIFVIFFFLISWRTDILGIFIMRVYVCL